MTFDPGDLYNSNLVSRARLFSLPSVKNCLLLYLTYVGCIVFYMCTCIYGHGRAAFWLNGNWYDSEHCTLNQHSLYYLASYPGYVGGGKVDQAQLQMLCTKWSTWLAYLDDCFEWLCFRSSSCGIIATLRDIESYTAQEPRRSTPWTSHSIVATLKLTRTRRFTLFGRHSPRLFCSTLLSG